MTEEGGHIIGLDFHVGCLIVEGQDIRFIHASNITHTVVDEPAARAIPIVTSRYRVVGKLLDDAMIEAWLGAKRIDVKGRW